MQRKPTVDPRHRGGKVSPAAMTSAAAPDVVPQDLDERLWDDHELAFVLKRSRSRIQKDRLEGRGPPFIRVGRLIRYRAADVRVWLKSSTEIPQAQAAAAGGQ